jgi:DUF1680 family protein
MGMKPYGCGITCCMSSVPRGIAMIPLFVNGKIDHNPTFLFYQPGTYTTAIGNNGKASFTTVTNFPADGRIQITVDETTSASYTLVFRKPYWAKDFSVAINGQQQVVATMETPAIKRFWKKGDIINIDFTMPVIVLDGGRSYPAQIALQRGPQVLAFDQKLNGFDAAALSINPNQLQVETAAAPLPAGWVGGTAFGLKTSVNNTEKNIVLVPYADASQTGGAISTWIKKQN